MKKLTVAQDGTSALPSSTPKSPCSTVRKELHSQAAGKGMPAGGSGVGEWRSESNHECSSCSILGDAMRRVELGANEDMVPESLGDGAELERLLRRSKRSVGDEKSTRALRCHAWSPPSAVAPASVGPPCELPAGFGQTVVRVEREQNVSSQWRGMCGGGDGSERGQQREALSQEMSRRGSEQQRATRLWMYYNAHYSSFSSTVVPFVVAAGAGANWMIDSR